MTNAIKPLMFGIVMGLMMLWMLHGVLTGQTNIAGPALVVFIGTHVLIVASILVSSIFLARLSPRLRRRLQHIHRPSLSHLFPMISGAIFAAATTHLILHGVG